VYKYHSCRWFFESEKCHCAFASTYLWLNDPSFPEVNSIYLSWEEEGADLEEELSVLLPPGESTHGPNVELDFLQEGTVTESTDFQHALHVVNVTGYELVPEIGMWVIVYRSLVSVT
jgi:hypothetical protein